MGQTIQMATSSVTLFGASQLNARSGALKRADPKTATITADRAGARSVAIHSVARPAAASMPYDGEGRASLKNRASTRRQARMQRVIVSRRCKQGHNDCYFKASMHATTSGVATMSLLRTNALARPFRRSGQQ